MSEKRPDVKKELQEIMELMDVIVRALYHSGLPAGHGDAFLKDLVFAKGDLLQKMAIAPEGTAKRMLDKWIVEFSPPRAEPDEQAEVRRVQLSVVKDCSTPAPEE